MNTCSSLAHLRSGSPRGQGPLAPRARHQRQLPEHPTLAATPAACSHVPCFIFFSNWPLRRRRGRTLPPPASRTRGWTPAGPARGLLRAQTRPGTGATTTQHVGLLFTDTPTLPTSVFIQWTRQKRPQRR